jgi:Protein of unknown function (DUF2798)
MKQRITFTLLMGIITTGIISFSLIALNLGIRTGFFRIWLRSWSVSYLLAVLIMIFIGPWVQVFANFLLKETETRIRKKKRHSNDMH